MFVHPKRNARPAPRPGNDEAMSTEDFCRELFAAKAPCVSAPARAWSRRPARQFLPNAEPQVAGRGG